jgi:hypothetical protein
LYVRLAALPQLMTLQGIALDTQILQSIVRDIPQPIPALRELRADLLSSNALPTSSAPSVTSSTWN